MSCGCFSVLPKTPRIQSSEYFNDISASIAVNTKNDQLTGHFSWLVELKKSVPPDAYMEAAFPDPDGGPEDKNPYLVPLMMLNQEFDKPRFYAVSPAVDKLKCGVYDLKISIFKDKTRMKVLSTHESQVLSRVDTQNCTREDFFRTMSMFA